MSIDRNIDRKCAEYGNRIADIDGIAQPLVNNALAVLLEQGVYALFLFLYSRGKKEEKEAKATAGELYSLLTELLNGQKNGESDKGCNGLLKNVREKFYGKLSQACLAKDLAEQALIYARYHLKAKSKGGT